jgi:aryl-alcohol dehydrogenase-like predicted oxidoreductase
MPQRGHHSVSVERLGALLSRAGPRQEWVICTKAGEEFDGVSGAGASRYDFSSAAIAASVERSLERLRVDALDVALLHFSGNTDDRAVLERGEAMGALLAGKRAGKIRAIGASISTLDGGMLAIERGCDVIMVTLNSAQRDLMPAIAAARARGIGVLVKKALGSGHLIAGDSLRWVVDQPGVGCAVVGTTSPVHLRENIEALREGG